MATDRCRTRLARRYALPLLLALGCGGGGSTPPASIETHAVGPAGGTLTFLGGAVRLVVPAGAVAASVEITARPGSTAATPAPVPGTFVEFGPSGQTFAVPVSLTLAYDPAGIPAGAAEAGLRIAEDTSGSWRYLPSSVDAVARTVVADLDGFSGYGIVPPSLSPGARWARTVVSAADQSRFNAIASDALGHTYAVGSIQGTGVYDFGGGVTAQGTAAGANVLIVKFDPDGRALWARTVAAGTAETQFHAVTVNGLGEVFAAGTIRNASPVDFGNAQSATGSCTWDRNALLVKYDAAGVTQWARSTSTGSNYSWFYGVTADGSGNAYAVGSITAALTYDFGNSQRATGPSSAWHPVVVKYSGAGVAQWARTVSASQGDCEFKAVTLDGAGRVTAAGYLTGFRPFDFGGGQIAVYPEGGSMVPVIVQYDSGGTTLWARTTDAGTNTGFFNGLARDGADNLYAVGSIMGSGTYGFGNSVTVNGAYGSDDNALLVKYDSGGAAQWARSPTAALDESTFYGVALGTAGDVWAVGFLRGTQPFAFGGEVAASGSDGLENPLLVKYDSSGTARAAFTLASGASTSSQGSLFRGVAIDNLGRPIAAGALAGDGTYGFGSGVTVKGVRPLGLSTLVVQYP